MNDSRLLVAIPSLYIPANYGRFSVWFLSPGGSYPPVYTVEPPCGEQKLEVEKKTKWLD